VISAGEIISVGLLVREDGVIRARPDAKPATARKPAAAIASSFS
jgi:hypothetical protein